LNKIASAVIFARKSGRRTRIYLIYVEANPHNPPIHGMARQSMEWHAKYEEKAPTHQFLAN